MRISKKIINGIKKESREYSFDSIHKRLAGRFSEIPKEFGAKLEQFKNTGQSQKAAFKSNKRTNLTNRKERQENGLIDKAITGFEINLIKNKYDKKGKEIQERRTNNNNNAQKRLEMKRQKNLDYLKEQGLI